MDNLNEKHPVLTAWIGFMAIMSVGALLLGLIFNSTGYWVNFLVEFVFYFVGGFFVFRFMIERHILVSPNSSTLENKENSSVWQKYCIETAWISFLVLIFLPNIFVQYLSTFVPYLWQIPTSLFLGILFGYFIFAFVVNRLIVSRMPSQSPSE